MRIVEQINGLIVNPCTRLYSLVTERLWKNVKPLLATITLKCQSAVNLLSQLAKTMQNIKALLANLIIQVQSIKAVLINVQVKLTQTGQQLLTTVRQIHLLVTTAFNKNKDPVDKTK